MPWSFTKGCLVWSSGNVQHNGALQNAELKTCLATHLRSLRIGMARPEAASSGKAFPLQTSPKFCSSLATWSAVLCCTLRTCVSARRSRLLVASANSASDANSAIGTSAERANKFGIRTSPWTCSVARAAEYQHRGPRAAQRWCACVGSNGTGKVMKIRIMIPTTSSSASYVCLFRMDCMYSVLLRCCSVLLGTRSLNYSSNR